MHMPYGRMGVRMAVGGQPIPGRIMIVLVVFVMDVNVSMGQHLVFMFMAVAFGEVQPDADTHHDSGQPE